MLRVLAGRRDEARIFAQLLLRPPPPARRAMSVVSAPPGMVEGYPPMELWQVITKWM